MIRIFPVHMREALRAAWQRMPQVEELRIRVNQPLAVYGRGEQWYLCTKNGLTKEREEAVWMQEKDIGEMLLFVSRYSLYAFEEEVREGYITLEGGHRVGVCGHAVYREGRLHTLRNICYLNLRISREYKGCARPFAGRLYRNRTGVYNTLLLSAPGMGKTTLLRDLVRLFSDGDAMHPGLKVSLVDERSEIAGCHLGVPQKDVGQNTDVLDGCRKSAGMMLMIRTMSPQLVAVDELGSAEDAKAVEQAILCGCSILGTIHAADLHQMEQKPILRHFLKEGYFERYLVIRQDVKGERSYDLYDENGEIIC